MPFVARTTAALFLAALSLAACSSEDTGAAPDQVTTGGSAPSAMPTPSGPPRTEPTSPDASRAPAPTPAPQTSVLDALTACMRDRGVDIPGKIQNWTPPPGYDVAKAQAAFQACMKKLSSGSPTPSG
ncbi:MAG TPA: hypothetical protein VHJ17_05235 [Thermomonospora sp.]|nr:hypothetical protein [Thermomonospora sp.]